MHYHHQKNGFSLLELTIAIAIIALLVAAVTVVGNVKDKANFNTMVDDVNNIAEAVDEFYNSYSGYPGDLYNATNYFGSIVDNGDGNGVIGTANLLGDENRDFWEHLSRAGLVTGSFDGGTSNEPGLGAMEAPYKNGGYYAFTTTTTSTATIAIVIGKYHTGTLTNSSELHGLITPADAEKYDLTYDDGNASTGNVIADDGDNVSAGDCHTTGTYNATNEEDACILHIVIVD